MKRVLTWGLLALLLAASLPCCGCGDMEADLVFVNGSDAAGRGAAVCHCPEWGGRPYADGGHPLAGGGVSMDAQAELELLNRFSAALPWILWRLPEQNGRFQNGHFQKYHLTMEKKLV